MKFLDSEKFELFYIKCYFVKIQKKKKKLSLQKVKDIPVISKDTKMPSTCQQILEKFLWLISTARNIIVVVTCAVGCWLLEEHLGESPVVLTGHVKPGLPSVDFPPFHGKVGNNTLDFFDMVSVMGSGCIVVPLLSILETIAIAKAFRKLSFILIRFF